MSSKSKLTEIGTKQIDNSAHKYNSHIYDNRSDPTFGPILYVNVINKPLSNTPQLRHIPKATQY